MDKKPIPYANPTIQVSSAQYDPLSKTTNVAIVDEDKDKITSIIKEIPMEEKGLGVYNYFKARGVRYYRTTKGFLEIR